MPRISRGLADGHCYHILNSGNGRQQVFHKDDDYRAFINLLGETIKRYSIELFAYCLMPNHFHLLLRTVQAGDLSRGMQWFMTSHVRRYHRHYGSSGHIWQGRFKSFIVEENDHLLTVDRYVEGNPLWAGIVPSLAEWPWSSHQENCGKASRILTAPLPCEVPKDWTAFVENATDRYRTRAYSILSGSAGTVRCRRLASRDLSEIRVGINNEAERKTSKRSLK